MLDLQNVSGDLVSGDELPLRMRRKLALECTECGTASPDAEVCASCRRKASKRQARWRDKRRRRKQCVDCGRRSKTRRCTRCKRKGVTERDAGVDGANHATDEQLGGTASKVVAKTETDGKTRNRYIGRGTRGAPTLEQIEFDDVRGLRFAVREIEKAIAKLEEAGRVAAQLPRIQRGAARREALAPAQLAVRFIDEVLDRNKCER